VATACGSDYLWIGEPGGGGLATGTTHFPSFQGEENSSGSFKGAGCGGDGNQGLPGKRWGGGGGGGGVCGWGGGGGGGGGCVWGGGGGGWGGMIERLGGESYRHQGRLAPRDFDGSVRTLGQEQTNYWGEQSSVTGSGIVVRLYNTGPPSDTHREKKRK